MTFSILVRDEEAGLMGGAAATGSLCVGGWVLRGDVRAGLSASQGAAPSTFWGEDVLALLRDGTSAAQAVADVTCADAGREARQLSALGWHGDGGAYTGRDNTPAMGSRTGPGRVVAGNLLAKETVLDAIGDGYDNANGPLHDRLLAALKAGEAAGSDSRGLLSAALMIVGPDQPPLTLRIDHSSTPLSDLQALLREATTGFYADWLHSVPVLNDPQRRPDGTFTGPKPD